jgi:hypothetical protein
MLSDDELRAAVETALKLGIECVRDWPKSDYLANLHVAASAASTPTVPVVPPELPFPLTRAEIADYLSLAAGDPDKARELAAAELALDFGSSLTSKHLQVLANVIDNAPEHDRATLALHMVDLLARWLLRERQALGPDGRIVVGVRSWGKARKIVVAWIGDKFGSQKNSTSDEPVPGPANARRKATGAASSASRRQRRPVDARKELIARLKAHNLNPPARKICELIDQAIDKAAPIRQGNLAPLKSWQMQAPGKRSWVELFNHPKTHNPVRTYVNKVPTLQTTARSSK